MIQPQEITVISKSGCRRAFDLYKDQVGFCKQQASLLRLSGKEVVIVVVGVKDEHGAELARKLMPDFDWTKLGSRPYVVGLAGRKGMEDRLKSIDIEESCKLVNHAGVCAVIVDCNTAVVYALES